MSNGIILNHHSLPFENIEKADNGILIFLKVLKSCRSYGLKILLVDINQDASLMRIQLTNGYFVSDWYNLAQSKPLLTDWYRLLRSLETKQQLFEQVDIDRIGGVVEVGFDGEENGNEVMLAAYWYKTFVASFVTIEKWQASLLSVWVLNLHNGDEVTNHQVHNLANVTCLEQHKILLQENRDDLLSTANDIWNNRASLFPNLTLLAKQIGTSLRGWTHRQDVLVKARDALNVLETFSSKWKNNEYDDYSHETLRNLGLAAEVSGESSSVNNSSKKKSERMFWLDDGREVYCENHVKLSDFYRLHFYVDSNKKHIYVAYLGQHMTL